jgi:lysophospholipase L1-like esterase
MIGVNDVASDVPSDRIVANVQQTIDRLNKAGVQVYLTMVLPVAQSYRRQINDKVDDLNSAYRGLAARTKATVVDFREKVRSENGHLRDEMTTDGIHLGPEGYRAWRDAISPLVIKHCQPPDPPAVAAKAPARPQTEFEARFGPWR